MSSRNSFTIPNAIIAVMSTLLAAGVWIYLYQHWPLRNDPPIHDPNAQLRESSPRTGADNDELEAINLFKTARNSVVNVDTIGMRRGFDRQVEEIKAGTGSGIVWDNSGRIVTNFHVVREAIQSRGSLTVRVVLADRTISQKVELVGIAPEYDLAVLKLVDVPTEKLLPIKLGHSSDLEVGQRVYAIGNPFGLSQTLTKGIVSALDREIESPTGRPIPGAIQIDAPINPGNSGGPLLDKDGRLIGVNTAITSPSGGNVGIGFAIPIDTVNPVITELIRNGKILRTDAGLKLLDQRSLRIFGYGTGVMVAQIDTSGPAAEAGLQAIKTDGIRTYAGDLILSIDDEEVRGNIDYERIIARHKPGDKINILIERGEKKLKISLTLRGI
jgi:S1-C subfamily serine protease